MGNPRIAKLEDQIHKIVARMLERRVKDPRLGFVTITEVRVTGDGREATIFYTDLGRSLDGREADAEGGVAAGVRIEQRVVGHAPFSCESLERLARAAPAIARKRNGEGGRPATPGGPPCSPRLGEGHWTAGRPTPRAVWSIPQPRWNRPRACCAPRSGSNSGSSSLLR